jgi:hypothetical protein
VARDRVAEIYVSVLADIERNLSSRIHADFLPRGLAALAANPPAVFLPDPPAAEHSPI